MGTSRIKQSETSPVRSYKWRHRRPKVKSGSVSRRCHSHQPRSRLVKRDRERGWITIIYTMQRPTVILLKTNPSPGPSHGSRLRMVFVPCFRSYWKAPDPDTSFRSDGSPRSTFGCRSSRSRRSIPCCRFSSPGARCNEVWDTHLRLSGTHRLLRAAA